MVEPAPSAFIRSIVQNLSVVLEKGHSSPFQDAEPALRQLGQKLSQIQDLLIDAERRRIKKEHSVSNWMDDLNELAYEMDEIIDETDIHWQEIEHATRSRAADNTSQVHKFSNILYTSNALISKIKKVLDRLYQLEKVANVTRKLGRDIICENWIPYHATFSLESSPVLDESEVYGREKVKEAIIELSKIPTRGRRVIV